MDFELMNLKEYSYRHSLQFYLAGKMSFFSVTMLIKNVYILIMIFR